VKQFKPDGFGIEINQFQHLLMPEFRRVGREQHLHLPLYGITNTENKLLRLRTIGSYLAQRKLRFRARSPGTLLLVQQLRDFPVGDHDDGPDALQMAMQLMDTLWADRQQQRTRSGVWM